MNIYLAKLKEKPVPNVQYKNGASLFLGQHKKEIDEIDNESSDESEDKDPNDDELTEEVQEDNPKVICKIRDKRSKEGFDYNKFMESLRKQNVFPVKKQLKPSQMPDSRDVEEPIDDISVELEQPIPDESVQEKEEDEEDEVKEEDEQEKPVLKPTKERIVIKRKPKKPKDIALEQFDGTQILEGSSLSKRLPKYDDFRMRASSYYMNNRKKFISHLSSLFNKYKQEIQDQATIETCDTKAKDTKQGEFNLMIHQRVVSDYLNLYTPYRGLLLYHGLGSGKTCTSISIAEGMKSQKKIFVLTLASLKANFMDQMKVCGDPIYRLDQYWEFISIEGKPDYISLLSNVLSLPRSSIEKRKGGWMVNVSKKSNYHDLNDEDRKVLMEQIDEMIRSKYIDVNYNGLTENNYNEKFQINDEKTTMNKKINPFDNSVVIIDEAHNFVSMIVNKMNKQDAMSFILYKHLMNATNAKIVLLSGTPIINYPNEIGIMFNILRGTIKTWNFPLRITEGGKSFTKNDIIQWFDEEGLNQYDYLDYSGENLTITRNPFGFVNIHRIQKILQSNKRYGGKKKTKSKEKPKKRTTRKKEIKEEHENILAKENGLVVIKDPIGTTIQDDETRIETIQAQMDIQQGGSLESYNGVKLDDSGNLNDTDFKKVVVKILQKHGLDTKPIAQIKSTNHNALPDNSKDFLEKFVELDSSEMKSKNVFQKRILGLTSYFKGANDGLYPRFIPSEHDPVYHIEHVPMSQYQFGIYEKIRDDESKQEKQSRKMRAKQQNMNAQELFSTPSTYRIASRQCCNFAFPDPPGRPRKNEDELIGYEVEEKEQDENPRKRKLKGGGDDDDEDVEDDDEDVEENDEDVEDDDEDVEDDDEDVEENDEDVEEKDEDVEEKEDEDEDKIQVLDNIVLHDIENLDEIETPKEEGEEPKVQKRTEPKKDNLKRISEVLGELRARKEEIFSPSGLKMYSPKFLRLLQNIQDEENKGLHLIYSQFRTLEGIALIKETLQANGYAEFRIQKISGSNDWEVVEQPEDKGKPKFALHTGTESDEEKKILLNVYNSKCDQSPSSIVSKFREENIENNHMGQAIKLLMITSSGAEGINLKNTRFVHIVEPYWNMVRPQQVIGRARRICSHQDLPEELRTVKVYLYMSVIPDEIKESDKHKNLRLRDVSRLSNKMSDTIDDTTMLGRYLRQLDNTVGVVTTDQQLFERALQKDQVNSQILNAVKESAMDCSLYENKDENLACYSFGQVRTNAFSTHPEIQKDIDEKDVKEVQERKADYREFTYDGKTYVQNKATKQLYNKYDFTEAQKHGTTMYPIGKEFPDKKKVIFYG